MKQNRKQLLAYGQALPGHSRLFGNLGTRFRLAATGLFACALLAVGCSKEMPDPVVNGDKVEVSFDIDGFDQWDAPSQAAASNSGPMAGNGEGGSSATRAAVNLATNTTVRVIVYRSGSDNPATANYITDQAHYWDGSKLVPCTVDDNGNKTTGTAQKMKLAPGVSYDFFAVSPALPLNGDHITLKTAVANGMDYATSVTANKMVTASDTVSLTDLARKCVQLTFVVQEDSKPAALTVNSMTVSGLPNAQSSVKPGADLTAATSGTQSLTLQGSDFTTSGTTNTSKQSYIYLPMSGAKLTFNYNLQVNGAQETIAGVLTGLTLEEGKKYTITANISGGSMITLTVNGWTMSNGNNPDVGAGDYPYVMDGKYIVCANTYGKANPTLYPLHGPWKKIIMAGITYPAVTPAHSESLRNTNDSGLNTVGAMFEVASTDASTSSPWADAKIACQNYNTPAGTQGQWRLPTIRELQLIYDKKNDLTDANLPTGVFYYWSVTESNSGSSYAWRVAFNDGNTWYTGKSYGGRVRCIRDL